MLSSHFDTKLNIVRTTVEGPTPNTELIQWLSDLSSEFQAQEELYIMLDMSTAVIEMDLRFYSFDMNDAMEAFMSRLGTFSKIAIANIISENDETNKVLIQQFSKLRMQLPSYYPEIFYDRESAEKWLLQQQSV